MPDNSVSRDYHEFLTSSAGYVLSGCNSSMNLIGDGVAKVIDIEYSQCSVYDDVEPIPIPDPDP